MSGLDSFLNDIARATGQLDALDRQIKAALPQAAEAGAAVLLEEAMSRAPMRTGKLKLSGRKRIDSTTPTSATAVVGFTSFYAKFLEYGTRKMAKRPYLRPAVDTKRAAIADAMTNKIRTLAKVA